LTDTTKRAAGKVGNEFKIEIDSKRTLCENSKQAKARLEQTSHVRNICMTAILGKAKKLNQQAKKKSGCGRGRQTRYPAISCQETRLLHKSIENIHDVHKKIQWSRQFRAGDRTPGPVPVFRVLMPIFSAIRCILVQDDRCFLEFAQHDLQGYLFRPNA
jgi:hypothetical protein